MRSGNHHHFLWVFTCSILTGLRHSTSDQVGFCLQQARSLPATADESWQQGSRSMPGRAPALAAYDWDMSTVADQQQSTVNYHPCHIEAPIYRYKVVSGVLYVDHEHKTDARYRSYRNGFLEMLVLSMWLYKDFPDIDLIVDYTDHPQLCDQAIPFLRYSIFNSSLLQPSIDNYNVSELLLPSWITPQYVSKLHRSADNGATSQTANSRVLPFTKGFTIPSPEAWRDLSLTPAQLQDYLVCLDTTHPWDNKRAVIYWRGAATGCSRGWPAQAAASSTAVGVPHLLRNKRVQLAMRVFPYPGVFDVGITSLPRFTPECLGIHGLHEHRGLLEDEQHPGGLEHSTSLGQECDITSQQEAANRCSQQGSRLQHAEQGSASDSRPSATQRQSQLTHADSTTADNWESAQHRTLAEQISVEQSSDDSKEDSSGSSRVNVNMVARAYLAVGYLLNKGEAIGMEGWASNTVTLSIDGYGPAYRLPQQLLLGSAVFKMASPYQTWFDWDLLPGVHYAEFAYNLSDVEQQGLRLLGVPVAAAVPCNGISTPATISQHLGPRQLADAARQLVVGRVDIFSQLDAFAWSVARYKEVCQWEVDRPSGTDKVWQVLQLDPGELFESKGVPDSVHMEIMLSMRRNFEAALQHPAYAAQLRAAGGN